MSLKKIIFALGIVASICQLLMGVALYLGAWSRAGERSAESQRLLAEAMANSIKRSLSSVDRSLDGARQYVSELDLSRPEVVQAAELQLKASIPYALVVRIVPDDSNTLDETRTPKMGYADLELTKQALLSDNSAPAAHAAGTPDAHIAMVKAVTSKHSVILASLSMNLLREALPGVQDGDALDLRQDRLSLASQGDEETRKDVATGTASIEKTPWAILYWAPAGQAPMAWWMLLVSVLPLVLLAGSFAFAIKWLAKTLADDHASIRRHVETMMSGRRLDVHPMTLSDYSALAQSLAQIREQGFTEMPEPRPQVAVQPVEPDLAMEITEIPALELPVKKAVPATIFRAYDIRGIVGDTLDANIVLDLGKAIGSEAHVKGEQRVFVARDGRKSSPELSTALIKGLQTTGRTVIDLGEAPTPVLYFATHVLNGKSGVMVTGSHNPANYNGLKIVICGDTLAEDDLQKLKKRVEMQDFVAGIGRVENRDISSAYIDRIVEDMQVGRSMKVVVDAGNGVAGKIAPALLKAIGCEVVELFCDIDSDFPNHHPDPSKPENLTLLIKTVIEEEADIGVAFDGDGDRLGLVDARGKIIWPDRQMMLFATDVLSRQPGADIIYDVKCSRHLAGQIVKNGGRPMMWKTGHSLIKAKMKQTGAMLAGEMSGHIFFKERWFGFDDGIYAAARMVEILSGDPRTTDEVFEEFPDSVNTPEINVALAEGKNFAFVERLKELALFPDARIIDIDGLRVDFSDGWSLVRASNTTPSLVIRFEADNEAALSRIQEVFRQLMLRVDGTLSLPF
jgi:phosphomannomutase/phosphoglucomutase